jgi:hypothetical protein
MSLTVAGRKALTEVVSAGIDLSAARLAAATHDAWRVAGVALSLDEAGPFASENSSVTGDTYGSHFTFAGGSFLVLFSGKSGDLVTAAFTRDFQERVENMIKRESVALGEVANILLNPLVGHLAKAFGVRLIISAPQTQIASPRDHLTRALERYRGGERLAATFFAALNSPQLFSDCRVLLFLNQALVGRIVGSVGAAPP